MAAKRLLSIFLALVIVAGLVYVLMHLLNPAGAQDVDQIKVTIANIYTARKIDFGGGKITSADITDRFEPTDKPIYLCYDLILSEPVTVTVMNLWYHESELVFSNSTAHASGTWCTVMSFTEPSILPLGNYRVQFAINGRATDAHINFSVVGKTG